MDALQAAILSVRLKKFEEIIQKRKKLAEYYHGALGDCVTVPLERDGECNSWYSYTICAEGRDKLKEFLESNGIETKIQHPILMPLQPAYEIYKDRAEIDKAKKIVSQILSIPAQEKLQQRDQDYVVAKIREFYGK